MRVAYRPVRTVHGKIFEHGSDGGPAAEDAGGRAGTGGDRSAGSPGSYRSARARGVRGAVEQPVARLAVTYVSVA